MEKPMFIAVEGGEGSGKSTLLEALKKRLGDTVLFTRAPGGAEFAEVIRNTCLKHSLAKHASPEVNFFLMFATIFETFQKLVKPALDAGKSVIIDRSFASTYAYQVFGEQAQILDKSFWELCLVLPVVPDWYIYLNVDVEEGLRRARLRNSRDQIFQNHFDEKLADFHERVRLGYETFFKLTQTGVTIINANNPFEKVQEDFFLTIDQLLGTKISSIDQHS